MMDGVFDLSTGLTRQEQLVYDALANAANAFMRLPEDHPSELREFCDAIHRAQDMLAVRIVRRHYPDGWITYVTQKPAPELD